MTATAAVYARGVSTRSRLPRGVTFAVLVAVLVVGCRRDRSRQRPGLSVAGDAAAPPDAVVGPAWQPGAIVTTRTVGTEVHASADELLGDVGPIDVGRAGELGVAGGVRRWAVPSAGNPVIGARLVGVTDAGVATAAKVTGLAQLADAGTSDEPALTLVLEPAPGAAGIPAVVWPPDNAPAVVYARVVLAAPDERAVRAAFAADAAVRELDADPPPELEVELSAFRAPDGATVAVIGGADASSDPCARPPRAVTIAYAVQAGRPPTPIGAPVADRFAGVVAVLDRDHDGAPEVVFGGQQIDVGMSIVSDDGAVWSPRADRLTEIAADSYYGGCD